MKKVLFSNDFLDRLKEGKKLFSDVILQYVDMSDMNFSEITFKNSKLFFATFRNCNFKNAKFVNCEIIYGSFYGGNLENTIFDNCVIDMTLFQKIFTSGMKILKSKLIWSAILESAISEVDISSSTQFKFFTDISQLTEKDLEDVMTRMSPLVDSLDISIKHKIKQEMEKNAQNHGVSIPKGTETHGYSAGTKNYSPPDLVNGMQNFSNMIIDVYNTTNPYKGKKSAYEKKDVYKN